MENIDFKVYQELIKARAKIVKNWWGYVVENDNGGFCAYTAFGDPSKTMIESNREVKLAWAVFCEANGFEDDPDSTRWKFSKERKVWRWNDAEGRTKEEILNAYDKAIKLAADRAGLVYAEIPEAASLTEA